MPLLHQTASLSGRPVCPHAPDAGPRHAGHGAENEFADAARRSMLERVANRSASASHAFAAASVSADRRCATASGCRSSRVRRLANRNPRRAFRFAANSTAKRPTTLMPCLRQANAPATPAAPMMADPNADELQRLAALASAMGQTGDATGRDVTEEMSRPSPMSPRPSAGAGGEDRGPPEKSPRPSRVQFPLPDSPIREPAQTAAQSGTCAMASAEPVRHPPSRALPAAGRPLRAGVGPTVALSAREPHRCSSGVSSEAIRPPFSRRPG